MKTYEPEELAAELKAQVIYGNDPRCASATRRVAELMGLKYWTVRDYFDGRIKPSLKFLHAVALATDGAVTWPLEPEGYRLVLDSSQVIPTKEAEPELTDVVLSVANVIRKVREVTAADSEGGKRITKDEASDLDCCLDEVERELAEAKAAVKVLMDSHKKAGRRLGTAA